MNIKFYNNIIIFLSAIILLFPAKLVRAEVRNILAMGTSLTSAYSWPDRLAHELKRCTGKSVDIENVSVAGANSSDALKQFEARKVTYPDVIIVEFSINDADVFDGVSRDKSYIYHGSLLAEIREKSPSSKVVLMTMNPVYGTKWLQRFNISHYYQLYHILSKKYNVIKLDNYSNWLKLMDNGKSKELIPDGLHPLDAISTSIILPSLLKVLSENSIIKSKCVYKDALKTELDNTMTVYENVK